MRNKPSRNLLFRICPQNAKINSAKSPQDIAKINSEQNAFFNPSYAKINSAIINSLKVNLLVVFSMPKFGTLKILDC